MDSPCIKQTVCKVFKIFQCGKYLVAYVLKTRTNFILMGGEHEKKCITLGHTNINELLNKTKVDDKACE